MVMRNKKGFTLVEILAVLVVLLVIVLIAVNIINSRIKEAKKNSVEVNANNYIKAVNGVAALSQNIGEDMESGTYQVRDLNKSDIKLSGDKPRKGFLVLSNYEVTYGCLMYEDYSAIVTGGKTSQVEKMNCNNFKLNAEFAYKGSEETFTVSVSGTYKIEVWGAQGGNAFSDYKGGYGGYSVGYIDLKKDDKLYINVGGQGESDCVSSNCNGGYNGGGNGIVYTGDQNNHVSGGGGATSIAFSSGLLSTLSSQTDKILIVGGAGGGAYYHINGASYSANGGNAGGYVGVSQCNSNTSYTCAGSGNQSFGGSAGSSGAAGSFGKGGSSTTYSSGGGAGFYGGGSAHHIGTGGGSGYIGNTLLFNRKMYCYNCSPSNAYSTETESVTCAEETPTEMCAKKGNGYAKITYISASEPNRSTKALYSLGDEVTNITGGWNKYESENGVSNKLDNSLQLTYSTASGDTTSQFITKNKVDLSGYNRLNVIYEIVSTVNWGKYSAFWLYAGPEAPQVEADWTIYSDNLSVGTYQVSLDISSLDKAYVYLMDCGVNIKIYHVWLSK